MGHTLLDCSKAEMRLNLFKSCKSLFLSKPTPICHHLRISSAFKATKYLSQSLQIQSVQENDVKILSKLYVTNRFEIRFAPIETLQQIIISKLSKCDARFITIFQQIISIKEFEFLINPIRVETFLYDNGGITNNDETAVVNLRLVLERLSNAYSIGIHFNQSFELSPITFSEMKRNIKIQSLWLSHFSALLDVEDYCNFILENASSNAKLGLGFSDNVTSEKANAFKKAINEFTLLNFSENLLKECEIGYHGKFKAENLKKKVNIKKSELFV